jgi:predicted transposase/invertase (TIGR01784 family)
MIANLDNEVHFKQVFTDVEVFCAFVKDVLNITIEIDKVETEKVISEPVSAIKFRMDLFAQSKDKRVIVEIQKVDYDYSYDRFSHYFLGNMIAMQRDSMDYSYAKEVYIIVVVTSAYRISEINGQPIKDDVLVTDINPRNLKGEIRVMNNHKMIILNTTYLNIDTPDDILDWMNLIAQSIKNPENPQINLNKPAIVKALQLANKDRLTPEQLADGKVEEMKKKMTAIIEHEGREKGREEGREEGRKDENKKRILQILKQGKLSKEDIAEAYEVSIEYINAIEKENT